MALPSFTNQRTAVTNTAGNYWQYSHDPIDQLTTASGAESNAVTRAQEQFGYTYDAAWNLQRRTNSSMVSTFAVDSLNQLTSLSRTTTGVVSGVTWAPATNVTVAANGASAVAAARYADWTWARTNVPYADGTNTFVAVAQDNLGRADTSSVTNYLPATTAFAYDGNGNVMALVNLSDGTTSAEYAYGPFAEPLQATGLMAKANPLRFSTQYADEVTGDVNYLFRPYTARTGRWASRDPIEEPSFALSGLMENDTLWEAASAMPGGQAVDNNYAFAGNAAVQYFDILGLRWRVERKGGVIAPAEPEDGDTVASLASLIGLKASDYRKWLIPASKTQMPISAYQPLKACDEFKIPNTVLAYWGGFGKDVGKDYVQWYRSIRYLKGLGFYVDEVDYVKGSSNLLKLLLGYRSSAKVLHGLYFWGHGSKTRLSNQDKYVELLYSDPGLEYGMALGLVFACKSNYGERPLMSGSPSQIWHGFNGNLIPHPFHRFDVKHFIHPGDQETKSHE